jgi:hypothetical protein
MKRRRTMRLRIPPKEGAMKENVAHHRCNIPAHLI